MRASHSCASGLLLQCNHGQRAQIPYKQLHEGNVGVPPLSFQKQRHARVRVSYIKKLESPTGYVYVFSQALSLVPYLKASDLCSHKRNLPLREALLTRPSPSQRSLSLYVLAVAYGLAAQTPNCKQIQPLSPQHPVRFSSLSKSFHKMSAFVTVEGVSMSGRQRPWLLPLLSLQ